MTNELFRYFIVKTFPIVMVDGDELDEINVDFTKYINNKCTPEQLEKFMPKSALEVIIQSMHPLKQNGFHPALVYHFTEFIKIQTAND